MYTEDAHPAKRQMLITEATVDESRYLTEQLASDELVILAIPGTLADANPEILAQTEILVPFVHSHIGYEQLEKMPKLRYITTRSTGYEHIHLAYAAQRGIVVSHVPGYGESTVAEHTFVLLLALSRKLYRALAYERGKGAVMSDLCGMDLFGKTLGVIGTGSIGSHVIQIARGFGMQVRDGICGILCCQWKRQEEGRALPFFGLKPEPSSMLFDECTAEIETQASASDASGLRIIGTYKPTKDLGLLLLRNANTSILHADVD